MKKLTFKSTAFWALLIGGGILTGTLFYRHLYILFHFMGSFFYFPFIILLAIFITTGLIMYTITRRKKTIELTVSVLLFICIATGTSNLVFKIAEKRAIDLAEHVIGARYVFRQTHPYFPETIDSLKTDQSLITRFKGTQYYKPNDKRTSFHMVA